MSLTSGQRIGVYEVIGPLGAGGMGEVRLVAATGVLRGRSLWLE